MKRQKKQTMYVSILTVFAPSASALLDMMRYDSCTPSEEVESGKIERLMSRDGRAEDHVIRLRRYSMAPSEASRGRWESFSCAILDERSPDEMPYPETEAIMAAARAVDARRAKTR